MRFGLRSKIFVIMILFIFFFTSIPIGAINNQEEPTIPGNNLDNIEQYIDLLDKDVKNIINKALKLDIHVYLTISTSVGGKASHIFLKMPRLITQHGIFIATLITYRNILARTYVLDLNEFPFIKEEIGRGRHTLFIMGIGYSWFSRPFFRGPGGVVAVSFIKPIVIK